MDHNGAWEIGSEVKGSFQWNFPGVNGPRVGPTPDKYSYSQAVLKRINSIVNFREGGGDFTWETIKYSIKHIVCASELAIVFYIPWNIDLRLSVDWNSDS